MRYWRCCLLLLVLPGIFAGIGQFQNPYDDMLKCPASTITNFSQFGSAVITQTYPTDTCIDFPLGGFMMFECPFLNDPNLNVTLNLYEDENCTQLNRVYTTLRNDNQCHKTPLGPIDGVLSVVDCSASDSFPPFVTALPALFLPVLYDSKASNPDTDYCVSSSETPQPLVALAATTAHPATAGPVNCSLGVKESQSSVVCRPDGSADVIICYGTESLEFHLPPAPLCGASDALSILSPLGFISRNYQLTCPVAATPSPTPPLSPSSASTHVTWIVLGACACAFFIGIVILSKQCGWCCFRAMDSSGAAQYSSIQ